MHANARLTPIGRLTIRLRAPKATVRTGRRPVRSLFGLRDGAGFEIWASSRASSCSTAHRSYPFVRSRARALGDPD